jgi:HK97 family phage portal protein
LHPDDVEISDGRYYVAGSDVPFAEGEIIHLRGEPPYKKGHGSGVIDRFGADLALAATVRTYAGSTYGTGVPAGYLKVNSPNLTVEQAADLKARWMEQHGRTQKSIAVLNATTEFHPIALSPIDGQLSKAREWSLRDVALAFGIPPYMLGIPGDQSTYANVESRMIELRTFTLLPWIRRIESTLDAQFPRSTSLKISTDATLRADTLSRYQAYSIGLSGGWLTVDEIRAMENRPPLPEQVSTNPADGTLPPVDVSPATDEPAPVPADAAATEEVSQ